MKSVADALRARTADTVRKMPVHARISLALSLGDDDLDLFVRASGLDRPAALRLLREPRARDRATPSRSASQAR